MFMFDGLHIRAMMRTLRRGEPVLDAELDRVYPLAVRRHPDFWSPVDVSLRAAELLDPRDGVLDIGSGTGKFCIVGSAATGIPFVGVEHRATLVWIARDAAHRLGVTTARFAHAALETIGTIDTIDVASFDGIYLFNPFEENLWPPECWLDDSVDLHMWKFLGDVCETRRILGEARLGTRVVTYHGFGAPMPDGYRLVVRERWHAGDLDCWIKEGVP